MYPVGIWALVPSVSFCARSLYVPIGCIPFLNLTVLPLVSLVIAIKNHRESNCAMKGNVNLPLVDAVTWPLATTDEHTATYVVVYNVQRPP